MSKNLTVKILEVSGLVIAARYVGLPVGNIRPRNAVTTSSGVLTHESLNRLNRLIARGDEHAKIMRQVTAHMEITGPRYWWQQWATYQAGVEGYSGSTMRTLIRDGAGPDDYTQETIVSGALIGAIRSRDLVGAKANLPEGFLQTRLVTCSYQTLRRMLFQRRSHKLGEWAEFLLAIRELPYYGELIHVEHRNPWRDLWCSLLDDVGILGDDKPDTLNITGLSTDQCDKYTSLVLELLHKESEQ